jgi:hypothetical protein
MWSQSVTGLLGGTRLPAAPALRDGLTASIDPYRVRSFAAPGWNRVETGADGYRGGSSLSRRAVACQYAATSLVCLSTWSGAGGAGQKARE